MTTQYIDQRNEGITTEEAIALYMGTAKPYPESWYESGYTLLESRNDSMDIEIEDAWAIAKSDVRFIPVRSRKGKAVAKYISVRTRWEGFSCPVNRWEALYCAI